MNRPWFQEDNRVDFEADGLQCAMRRGPLGSWCGYVRVPADHPWFGKDYSTEIKPPADALTARDKDDYGAIDLLLFAWSDNPDPENSMPLGLCLRVHGGITWARNHEPFGEPDGGWWFGFDCAHCMDLVPSLAEQRLMPQESLIYRTQEYVVAECQSLAAQLVRIK